MMTPVCKSARTFVVPPGVSDMRLEEGDGETGPPLGEGGGFRDVSRAVGVDVDEV